MKTLLFLLFATLSFIAQGQVSLRPDKFVPQNKHLSFLADDVQFISFDPVASSQIFSGHHVTKDHVILWTSNKIFIHDRKGHFQQMIENKHPYRMQVAVNEKEQAIYVLNIIRPDSCELSTYTFDGKLQSKKGISSMELIPEAVIYSGGHFFLIGDDALMEEKNARYQWVETDDATLQTLYAKEDTDSLSGRDIKGIITTGKRSNNQLLYWNPFNDSIFHIKERGYEVPYVWEKGDYRFTQKDAERIPRAPDKHSVRLRRVNETSRYLIVKAWEGEKNDEKLYIYDKADRQFIKSSPLQDDVSGSMCKIDFLNYFKIDNEEFLTARLIDLDIENILQKQNKKAQGGAILVLVKIKR